MDLKFILLNLLSSNLTVSDYFGLLKYIRIQVPNIPGTYKFDIDTGVFINAENASFIIPPPGSKVIVL